MYRLDTVCYLSCPHECFVFSCPAYCPGISSHTMLLIVLLSGCIWWYTYYVCINPVLIHMLQRAHHCSGFAWLLFGLLLVAISFFLQSFTLFVLWIWFTWVCFVSAFFSCRFTSFHQEYQEISSLRGHSGACSVPCQVKIRLLQIVSGRSSPVCHQTPATDPECTVAAWHVFTLHKLSHFT